jgi:hypothetical protein
MTKQIVLATLACAILSTATAARAQESSEQAKPRPAAEVTPFVSLGSGTGVGAAVRWPLGSSPFSVEVETNYRPVEIGTLSFNLSLLYDLPKLGPAVPYVAGGVGIDQYGSAEFLAGKLVGRERTAFSVNAGGGLRVQTDEDWGVRADARWFKDVGRMAPERWRLYNGVTLGGLGH